MICKKCGKKSESEYCFAHKPRKALNGRGKLGARPKVITSKMRDFFVDVWQKRKKHECENCGKWLGKEPLSYMFDHVLEKSKHPDLKFEENNIMLLCLECHDNKTRGILTEKIKEKIEKVKNEFQK
jgi:hypothetical protein